MIQRAATDGSPWGLKEKLLAEMLWNRHCHWTNPSHFALPGCRWQRGSPEVSSLGGCQLHHHCILAHLSLLASFLVVGDRLFGF